MREEYGKLITFANNNYDSKQYTKSKKNEEGSNDRVVMLEDENMELREVISHLKEENLGLANEIKMLQRGAKRPVHE